MELAPLLTQIVLNKVRDVRKPLQQIKANLLRLIAEGVDNPTSKVSFEEEEGIMKLEHFKGDLPEPTPFLSESLITKHLMKK
jgi:hypothetical protein